MKIIHCEDYTVQFMDKVFGLNLTPTLANLNATKELNKEALKNLNYRSGLFTTYCRATIGGYTCRYLIQSTDNINNYSLTFLN
jgi:hypothetical protein